MSAIRIVLAAALLHLGCHSSPITEQGGAGGEVVAPGGEGGAGGSVEGTGGAGGKSSPGDGGSGGTRGGPAREEPPDFDPAADLGLPGEWRFVELNKQPSKFWFFEGQSGSLNLPAPVWEPCGPGCEFSSLNYLKGTHQVVVSSEMDSDTGAVVTIVGMRHSFEKSNFFLNRIVRLSDGVTIGALLAHPRSPELYPAVFSRPESARSILASDSDSETFRILYVSLESTGQWNFREPWDTSGQRATSCKQFDLDSSPSAYLFACPHALEIMAEAGNSRITAIPDSKNAVNGAGNFGEAVWVEHDYELPFSSRIRAWSPGKEPRTLAEIPDFVCGLGIGPDKIVGLRGLDELYGQGCWGGLAEARFFKMNRDGGEIEESPVLPGEARGISDVSVYGDWLVARLALPPTAGHPRRSIVIVRLSDWTIRQIWEPEGRTLANSSVAVDDEYFYFTTEYSMVGNHGFDRLYRYRLDHFEQIGEPIFPAP